MRLSMKELDEIFLRASYALQTKTDQTGISHTVYIASVP